jgi:cyclopropane-fatty-acyl-phospholipid synthase
MNGTMTKSRGVGGRHGESATSAATRGGSLLERAAWKAALAVAARIRVGRLTVVEPNGRCHVFGGAEAAPAAELHVHDRAAALRIVLHGEVGAGEAYVDGQWSSPDVEKLLELAALNRDALDLGAGPWRRLAGLPRRLLHRSHRNTVQGSRKNIAAHYDLSNDLYRLFLDETMTYSSAVFESADQSLADAQRAKYRRIAERAGLRPGMHVLEIGSGWGGFAMFAAGELGCRVTTVTISRAQHDLAVERIREAGLSDLVDVQLRDYRHIEGTYDAVVSIEMLEAVGPEYYPAFFGAVDRALKPGGKLSLQVITFPDGSYERQLRGANWIQLYIFPGGVLPSLAAMERAARGTRLLLAGVDDIRLSYARTLREWRTRFMGRLDEVRSLGFDDRFIRTWEYYLAISEAGFATGLIQDVQVVMEKGRGLETAG